MNRKSLLCRFINEHQNDWKEKLEEKKIAVREDGELCIFTYGIAADFSDPLVREARGIIINVNTLDVVCWPFHKFGNWSESYADAIDWSTARIQDKIDGSITKLWFDETTGKWQVSTNGIIRAENAGTGFGGFLNFDKLFRMADNFGDIRFQELNRQYTYIFELVSPENRVVIKYDKVHLYHIGTRSNITGEEFVCDIGIEHPKEYPLHSLDECIEAARLLNSGKRVEREGFVVVDANWKRIKIKSPDYLALHHMVDNGNISKKHIIALLMDEKTDIVGFTNEYPLYAVYFFYYKYKIEEVKDTIRRFVPYVRSLYEELNHERRAVALQIAKHPYARFGYMALDHTDKTADDFISMLTPRDYISRIEDYEEVPLDIKK